jgi:hypothetical protein
MLSRITLLAAVSLGSAGCFNLDFEPVDLSFTDPTSACGDSSGLFDLSSDGYDGHNALVIVGRCGLDTSACRGALAAGTGYLFDGHHVLDTKASARAWEAESSDPSVLSAVAHPDGCAFELEIEAHGPGVAEVVFLDAGEEIDRITFEVAPVASIEVELFIADGHFMMTGSPRGPEGQLLNLHEPLHWMLGDEDLIAFDDPRTAEVERLREIDAIWALGTVLAPGDTSVAVTGPSGGAALAKIVIPDPAP